MWLRTSILISLLLCSTLWISAQSSNPVGSAYNSGGDCYVVTSASPWQLGAVWFNEPLNLDEPFEITLEVNLGSNDAGADGLVFVLQNIGISALGEAVGGIGFQGFNSSLGIELDTFQNNDYGDPDYDHIAIISDGSVDHLGPNNLSGPVSLSSGTANIEDGQNHLLKVKWIPQVHLLEVYFDCDLRLSYHIDIPNVIFYGNSTVYWGFTGATGGAANLQSACLSEFALGLQEEYNMCAGEPIQIGVVGDEEGSYSWEPAEFVTNPHSPSTLVSPPTSTDFTLTYTDPCGEQIELETTVNVTDVDIGLPDSAILCEGSVLTLVVEGNANSYLWSNGVSGNSIEVDSPGEVWVVGTVGDCSAELTTTVTTAPLPIADNLENYYAACEGESIWIDATADQDCSYSWSNSEQNAQIEVTESATLVVEITTDLGCSLSFPVDVEISPFPVIELDDEISSCSGIPLFLSGGSGTSWEWNTGETTQSIAVANSGWYSVIAGNYGCMSEDSTHVTINPSPEFDWPPAVDICLDSEVWLPLPPMDVLWFWQGEPASDSVLVDGNGIWQLSAEDEENGCVSIRYTQAQWIALPNIKLDAHAILCDEMSTRIEALVEGGDWLMWSEGTEGSAIYVANPGTYTLTAENMCGSSLSTVDVVAATCSCPSFVPNSFTPDLDGLNELFLPRIACQVRGYRFSVFNRWGEVVFQSDTPDEGWNGSGLDGAYWVPEDLYIWQLIYHAELYGGDRLVQQQGFVAVIR
jgi:gliding motility-associated-like protein